MSSEHSLELCVQLALDGFPLDVEYKTHAHVTGVFGPSGSGKTSLLETVAGLRPKARGRIVLDGKVWSDSDKGLFLPPEQRRIGYVPQDGLLFPDRDVAQNLRAGERRARAAGHPVDETYGQVVELLELGSLLERRPRNLSGGERQRVALGRALCSGPELLLLDEPLASIDLELRRRLLPFLRRIRAEFSVPMVLVSHDPVEVQALCDDLVVLSGGRVVRSGGVREVMTDPSVFPWGTGAEFENVVTCKVVENRTRTSTVQVEASNGEWEWTVPFVGGSPGDSVLIGVGANQILIAITPPTGLSARNIMRGVIRELQSLDDAELLTVTPEGSGVSLCVEVTRAAAKELELCEGRSVYLVLKSSSCHVLERPS